MNILCIVQSMFESNGCDTYHGETLMYTTQDEDQAINWLATEIFNNWRDKHYGKNSAVTLADSFIVVNGYAPQGWIDGSEQIHVPQAESAVMFRVIKAAESKSDKMKSEFICKKKEEEAAKQRAQDEEDRATYERLREKFSKGASGAILP